MRSAAYISEDQMDADQLRALVRSLRKRLITVGQENAALRAEALAFEHHMARRGYQPREAENTQQGDVV